MKKSTKKVLKEKAIDFLVKMGHNDVKIVGKLEEAPTQVSILDLILASENHRQILLKVLGEAHLPKILNTERFDHLIGHILDNIVISFINDDIPVEGTKHRKPLHIIIISPGFVTTLLLTSLEQFKFIPSP